MSRLLQADTLKDIFDKFWAWYERHYKLNVTVAAFLFTWQLVHLFWLATTVISERLTGVTLLHFNSFWEIVIIFVDYTEIPAIITTTLVYLNQIRKHGGRKPYFYLFLLHSQWLHLFWITDEFVVERLSAGNPATVLPMWLAWIAIGIDYLELPVIYDTIKRAIKSL